MLICSGSSLAHERPQRFPQCSFCAGCLGEYATGSTRLSGPSFKADLPLPIKLVPAEKVGNHVFLIFADSQDNLEVVHALLADESPHRVHKLCNLAGCWRETVYPHATRNLKHTTDMM